MPAFVSKVFASSHKWSGVLLVVLLLQLQPLISSTSLTPPPGNSIAFTAIASDGKLEYMCKRDGGEWFLLRKIATLKDQRNHTKLLGFYASNPKFNLSTAHVGSWTLINSDADQAESGQARSLVSGKQVAINQNGRVELQNFLARASLHRYEGSTRRVSYISQLNIQISSHLPSSKCEVNKGTFIIYFKANYVFWKQDLLPPKVPRSLSVPINHQPVEAFFAKGVIRYIYDPKLNLWRQRKMLARLYDVPGGIQMGGLIYNMTLSTLTHSSHQHNNLDPACITINDPNGFQVCWKGYGTPMSVNQSSLPWSLFRITHNDGNITRIIGPFTFVQMVSTWQGLPPHSSNTANVVTSFQVWKSPFTAIFWLYTKTKF